jgi:nitrite reductase (cytochrome c-552)
MRKTVLVLALVLVSCLAMSPPAPAQSKAAGKPAAKADASVCYGCHAPIKEFHAGSKHKGVSCASCHDGTDKHLADSAQRPVTRMDPANCGGCHKLQYESFATTNWNRPARSEKSQMTGPSPNPAWDKLMMPHGFTREHNLPRSHSFALLDQLLIDRAFGGRYAPKNGWQYLGSRAP